MYFISKQYAIRSLKGEAFYYTNENGAFRRPPTYFKHAFEIDEWCKMWVQLFKTKAEAKFVLDSFPEDEDAEYTIMEAREQWNTA
jgi:hypothetical protein